MSTYAVISLVIWLLFGANNIWLARKDGRSMLVWFFLTAPFGLLATGFLIFVKTPEPNPARWDSPGSFRREFVAPRTALVLSAVALMAVNATSGAVGLVLLVSTGVLFVSFVALTVVGVRVARLGVAPVPAAVPVVAHAPVPAPVFEPAPAPAPGDAGASAPDTVTTRM